MTPGYLVTVTRGQGRPTESERAVLRSRYPDLSFTDAVQADHRAFHAPGHQVGDSLLKHFDGHPCCPACPRTARREFTWSGPAANFIEARCEGRYFGRTGGPDGHALVAECNTLSLPDGSTISVERTTTNPKGDS